MRRRKNAGFVYAKERTRTPHKQHQYSMYNRTGYRGVFYDKAKGRYRAAIRVDGKLRNLGYFDRPYDAAHAYNMAVRHFHWNARRLNIVPLMLISHGVSVAWPRYFEHLLSHAFFTVNRFVSSLKEQDISYLW